MRKTLIYPVDFIYTSCATQLWRNRKPRAATGDTERGNLQELKQPHGRSNPLYPVRFIYVLYHFVYKKLSIPLILYYFHLQLFHLLSPVYNIISSVPFHLCYVGQSSILAFLSRIISCLFYKSYWTKLYHCMLYRENLNARILCTCSKPVISKVCLYMIYLHDSVSYFCTDFERRKETGTYAYSVRLNFIGALIRFLVFYYVHLDNSFGFSKTLVVGCCVCGGEYLVSGTTELVN
jgi:hypothetical protein